MHRSFERAAHADQRAAGCPPVARQLCRQLPTLCLEQRIAKGRKEKPSVVVSTSSLQVPTDQDPLRKNPQYNEWSNFPKSWNQGVLESGVATPTFN